MALSRRAFLARNGLAAGVLLAPGGLLAALEAATPPTPKLDDWKSVRSQFRLDPRYLHFAAFYISTPPPPGRDAIDAWRKTLDENPFLTVEQGMFEADSENLQSRVREVAAAYLGGKHEAISLTQNPTTGLALIYLGLPLKPGNEVLCTEHDHVVHHQSIRFACDRSGATYRKIPLFTQSSKASADEIVGRIRDAVRPSTRVV